MAEEMAVKARKVLVAVDESEESMHALSWYLKNVMVCHESSKDTIILLYVQAPRVVYTALDGTGYLFSTDIVATMDKYNNDVADYVIEKAKKICTGVARDIKVDAKVVTGDPREVICQMVEKLNVGMLVMGSHGYGLIKRTFLGSVSHHCAEQVKCPVLIVKKPKTTSGTK